MRKEVADGLVDMKARHWIRSDCAGLAKDWTG
jgi:hypothetical protein